VTASRPRTVAAFFAHPDDETFGPGGTMAMLGALGHDVHLVTATRGESGTIGDSASFGRRRLAALRERELREACRVLGLRPPHNLTFPDGGLARLEEETLLRPFVRALRSIRPEVVIAFHTGGISGHPDHRTVTARARTAFDLAADGACWPYLGAPHAADRFWMYCIPESRAALFTTRRLVAVPDDTVDATLDVTRYLPAKMAAVDAHATQKPFVQKLQQALGDLGPVWGLESFQLAEAVTPLPRRPVDDLFEGMVPARDQGTGRPGD